MLPTHVAVKIDDPDSEFHGDVGFIRYNKNSGIVKPCPSHKTREDCIQNNCQNAEELPDGWYEIVFDPMDTGGFDFCKEWFAEEQLVINGC